MDQPTHAWIAVRAIALLEDNVICPDLVSLVKPHVLASSIGAWIPDESDSWRGGNAKALHTLKMGPMNLNHPQRLRFIKSKQDLTRELGSCRKAYQFLRKDNVLSQAWWNDAYRAEKETHGKHLANRAMGLSVSIADLLLMGDADVNNLVPGNVSYIQHVPNAARTHAEAVAVYMAMMSHFIADSWMPCHTDGRKLTNYSMGLHNKMEEKWGKIVESDFHHTILIGSSALPDAILTTARNYDSAFGVQFGSRVNNLKNDVWLDTIFSCRASFAICGMIASPSDYPYGDDTLSASFSTVFASGQPYSFQEITSVVMHDAVMSTAMVYKHIWQRVSR
jgi:hypothetical protein